MDEMVETTGNALTDSKIKTSRYSLSEELISSISHGVGALLSIAALVLCIVFSSLHHNVLGIISSVIYGVSLIILYVMSCLYHALKPNKAKDVFRIFDHCSIFLLIAGSYTPYLLLVIGGTKGIIMLIVEWTAAIIGIIGNCINLEKFRKISFPLYLIMGWNIIFSFKTLINNLETKGVMLLLIGGIIYTLGAVIYLFGKKVKYMHSVWHFFVLGGSIFQFFSILLYVL